jgi:uncharacterized spore protein YtfJ
MSGNGFDEALKAVRERLVNLAKDHGVFGQTLNLGETVILPLCEIKVGFGGGGGEGRGEGERSKEEVGKGEFIGGFGGGGVRVIPTALVIIDGDQITLESLEEGGA